MRFLTAAIIAVLTLSFQLSWALGNTSDDEATVHADHALIETASITPLSGENIVLLTDGYGHYILISNIPLESSDGRKTGRRGDNVFFGSPVEMHHAVYNRATSGGGRDTTIFSDGAILEIEYAGSSRVITQASLTCPSESMKGFKVQLQPISATEADSIAASARLMFNSLYRPLQIFEFKGGNYLVVDTPIQSATPESQRYWYGKPGQMERLENLDGIRIRKGKKLIRYAPDWPMPWERPLKRPSVESFGIAGLVDIADPSAVEFSDLTPSLCNYLR